ncbi:MAG: phosphotransferase [Gammaproteobacteria bacterium]|nr:phosphotransferase [Gammaproteobacteria bacterium]
MKHEERIVRLPCWQGPLKIAPLSGGMTNENYLVVDQSGKYVVRVGDDSPEHLILRSNEVASGRAAHSIGSSPEVIHSEKGILVIRYIEGEVCDEQRICDEDMLPRVITLIKHFHDEMLRQFSGFPIMFWVFQVIRHYRNVLIQHDSHYLNVIPDLVTIANDLEKIVGPVELVFGHNDLLAANFIDDGQKLWLIDFDYAGFNSPLFDLSNLASNNGLSQAQERWMLETYYLAPLDDQRWQSYNAMKCASLLRETIWSMVSESISSLDFDFPSYTKDNMARFERIYLPFKQEFLTS